MECIYSEIAEFAYVKVHLSSIDFHDVMLPKIKPINRKIQEKQATFMVRRSLSRRRENLRVNCFFIE